MKDDGDYNFISITRCCRAEKHEELAEFLIDLADDGNLKIREWLKQPAGEEDKLEAE